MGSNGCLGNGSYRVSNYTRQFIDGLVFGCINKSIRLPFVLYRHVCRWDCTNVCLRLLIGFCRRSWILLRASINIRFVFFRLLIGRCRCWVWNYGFVINFRCVWNDRILRVSLKTNDLFFWLHCPRLYLRNPPDLKA